MTAPPSVRGYFALVERGVSRVLRSELAGQVNDDGHPVLRAAGLTRPGHALTTWHCDHTQRRCGREVVAGASDAAPYAAVCEGSYDGEDPCAAVELTAAELAQETIAIDDLVRVVRALYRTDGAPPVPSSLSASCAEPLLLGTERTGDAVRDVLLVLRPGDATFPLFLAARERASRGALVLVPTAARLGVELPVRYAPGAHVEIEALEDAVAVRDGKLARVTKLRLVPPEQPPKEPAPAVARPGKLAAALGASSFTEIRITVVDGHTLRIGCGKKAVRRTYVDLGLHAGNTREPTKLWAILLAVCEGHGEFRWRQFGPMGTVSTSMTRLRAKLCAAFGLDEDPFFEHHAVKGWKAKFFASSEIGAEGT